MSYNSKILFLFLQSDRSDTYVNVITHCIENEMVNTIYFIEDEKPIGEKFKSIEIINNIRERIDILSKEYESNKKDEYKVYTKIKKKFPDISENKERLRSIKFTAPRELLSLIENLKAEKENIIIDITGCNKRIYFDITVFCLAFKITNVRYFALSSKVYTKEWKNEKKVDSYLYHNLLTKDNEYYEYANFSNNGVASNTIDKLLKREQYLTYLLLVFFIIFFSLSLWIFYDQSTQLRLSQFSSIILSIILGFANILNIKEKLKS